MKLINLIKYLEDAELPNSQGFSTIIPWLKRELQLYLGIEKNKKINLKSGITKLQIGSGSHYLESFVNLDMSEPADVICDVREGLDFLPDKYFSYIFSEHFLEHIDYPKSVKKHFTDCYRILKEGGSYVIGVPDTEMILRAYLNKDQKVYETFMATWYKSRNHENFNTYIDLVNYHMRDEINSSKYTPHLWGYDFEKLTNLAMSSGFSDCKKRKYDPNIANPKRLFGTLYVECVK